MCWIVTQKCRFIPWEFYVISSNWSDASDWNPSSLYQERNLFLFCLFVFELSVAWLLMPERARTPARGISTHGHVTGKGLFIHLRSVRVMSSPDPHTCNTMAYVILVGSSWRIPFKAWYWSITNVWFVTGRQVSLKEPDVQRVQANSTNLVCRRR